MSIHKKLFFFLFLFSSIYVWGQTHKKQNHKKKEKHLSLVQTTFAQKPDQKKQTGVLVEKKNANSTHKFCAVIASFEGDVQILDQTRSHLLSIRPQSPIPCGAWISVQAGALELLHKRGFEIRAGSQTFLEIFEGQEETVLLYEGKIYVKVFLGDGTLRVKTANSLVGVKKGVAFVLYSPEDQKTQLIGVEGRPWMVNRFLSKKKVFVRPGELSSLAFDLLRVLPSEPQAVSVKDVVGVISQLHLEEEEKKVLFQVVLNRSKRRFPSLLVRRKMHPSRSLSQRRRNKKRGEKGGKLFGTLKNNVFLYKQHTPFNESDMQAQEAFERHVAGGVLGKDKILYPKEVKKGKKKYRLKWLELQKKKTKKMNWQVQKEKRAIIKKLKQIQELEGSNKKERK